MTDELTDPQWKTHAQQVEDPHALVHGITHVFQDPTSVDLLVQEIRIHCERCGMTVLSIPGHHLPAVITILEQVVQQFPLQTGPLAELPNPQGES